jgi:hypothetical protein
MAFASRGFARRQCSPTARAKKIAQAKARPISAQKPWHFPRLRPGAFAPPPAHFQQKRRRGFVPENALNQKFRPLSLKAL